MVDTLLVTRLGIVSHPSAKVITSTKQPKGGEKLDTLRNRVAKREDGSYVVFDINGRKALVAVGDHSSAGVTAIMLDTTGCSESVAVHWNGVVYTYWVNHADTLAQFMATESLGKTANFVKKNGELLRKFTIATGELVNY